MPTLIDRYLLEIETNQEGLWSKIRKFFEINKIKHPKYKKIIDVNTTSRVYEKSS